MPSCFCHLAPAMYAGLTTPNVGVVARAMLNGLKLNMLLFSALGALAPILATLTNSISDDTITAMTIVFLIIHVGFHDYGYTNGSKRR
jgi:Phosphatidylinositol N-acetylglucosaminyltransferase